MVLSVLKVLLTVYILYSLVKCLDFFLLSYERRMESIRAAYRDNDRGIRIFDNTVLTLMLILLALLLVTGVEYVSFATGLLVGMTLIQVYFHRFSAVIPAEKSPELPVSPIKMMSYAIQENPGRAWRELIFMTVLFLWSLYMLWMRK